jgi:hypothetical protein
MAYALEYALHQWLDGERRVRDTEPIAQSDLESAVDAVLYELRKRLGGAYEVSELADLYGSGTDWAEEIAGRMSAGSDTAAVVDTAFARYARGATDFAGGRRRWPEP